MKDIVGYESLYAITEDGKVWSYPKTWTTGVGTSSGHQGKWLATRIGSNGYVNISFIVNKVSKTFTVHRLVALAYLPKPENKSQVNHIDGNKQNNDISNLEWCSPGENIRHSFSTGLSKNYVPKHNNNCSCFRCNRDHINHFRKGQKHEAK